MYQRNSTPFLLELLAEFRILYLTGPRQAGKTTLAKMIAAERGMQYLSLDEEAVAAAAHNDPHGFIQSFAGQNLVLDEFQYAPELTPAIKRACANNWRKSCWMEATRKCKAKAHVANPSGSNPIFKGACSRTLKRCMRREGNIMPSCKP
ncbi:MAG: AAA family ATPase [Thiothrix litoralis]